MNSIRRALSEGRPSFGISAGALDYLTAELIGGLEFDWVFIDCQHFGMPVDGLGATLQALRAGGPIDPIVRVPWNDPPTIMRVLDMGAVGVIVPMVNTAAEARAAAAAMRYPPLGIRSYGPTRKRYDSLAEANADVVLLAMIETREGLENVAEIAATEGVDGLFVGPADLGLGLGEDLDLSGTNSSVAAAIDSIVAAAERHGKFAGTVHFGHEHAESLLGRGIRFLNVGSVPSYIRAGARADLERVRTWTERFSKPPG